jgi:hypothetical protein
MGALPRRTSRPAILVGLKMDKTEKTKTISTATSRPKLVRNTRISEREEDPFKRRGSVTRSPSTLQRSTSKTQGSLSSLGSLEQEKRKKDEEAGSARELVKASSREQTGPHANNAVDPEEDDETSQKIGSEDITLKEVQNERTSLEEFLFNGNNKISKNAIKFILSKWMFLEGKLQKELIERERSVTILTKNCKIRCRNRMPRWRPLRDPVPGYLKQEKEKVLIIKRNAK